MRACSSACSATEEERERDARGPALGARRAAAPRRRRAAPEAHADARVRATTTRADAPRARAAARAEPSRSERPPSDRSGARRRASRSCASSATDDRFVLVTHEHPDGDALGSLVGDAAGPRGARQGLGHVHVRATTCRCRTSTPGSTSTAWSPTLPADVDDAHARLPGLRQHRPQPGRGVCARATTASSTSTTTTTTRASATSTTSCRRRRARPRSSGTSCATSASQPTRGDRRGALRRPRHRHRALHVREHRAARAR